MEERASHIESNIIPLNRESKTFENSDAILVQQKRELKNIQVALEKIKDQTYGICEMCEEEIAVERLEVKPFAKYCMDCRLIYEKNS